MSKHFTVNPKLDLVLERFIDAPRHLGCFLEVVPMERLSWTSMLFPGYRPAVFDDIPITAIVTMETVGTGTRYVFTALHRDEADFEKNKMSGWQQGTEIARGSEAITGPDLVGIRVSGARLQENLIEIVLVRQVAT